MSDHLVNYAASQVEQSRAVNQELEMQRLRERLGSGQERKQELRDACMQFEAVFIQRMWEQMRATVPKEGYLHSKEQDMYISMFDQEMSMEMTRAGGIGLADILFDQLKERLHQSGADAASDSSRTLSPFPARQDYSRNSTEEQKNEKQLVGSEINRILSMDVSPEKRLDYLAAQIEYSFGGKPLNDLPELDDKVEGIDNLPEQDGYILPPLNWPVSGAVSSGFGWRDDPFTGKQVWHAGIDFAVPEGTEVEACWPGKVIFSGPHGGFGNKVILEHAGGWKSVYAHNSKNVVKVGDRVEPGEKIALSGNTGRSTGPHLHFELRQGELAWNPNMIKERLLAGLSIGHSGEEERT